VEDLISLIATTCNQERALDTTLRALAMQSDRNFEVIIADDGSGESTARIIAAHQQSFPVSLHHVWHEHHGFRAALCRNRAVLKSRGDYVVFLDGDCVPRIDFVSAHRGLAEPGWFVSGNRSLLSEALTRRVLDEKAQPASWDFARWARERRSGGVNRLAPLLRLPLGPLRKVSPTSWQNVRSCNLGIWRSDFDRVDGFDASYVGWGREDSDLAVRLVRAGVRHKIGEFMTGLIHLWHPSADRSGQQANDSRLEETRASSRIRAVVGLSAIASDAVPS
jgi:glycosyltransferase involved in cell wall biosynthesis